jgi:hypothetical protein
MSITCRLLHGIVKLTIEGIAERQFMCYDHTEQNIPYVRLRLLLLLL